MPLMATEDGSDFSLRQPLRECNLPISQSLRSSKGKIPCPANSEQAILEKVQALPDKKQQEVLALVDEMLKEEPRDATARERPANLGNH